MLIRKLHQVAADPVLRRWLLERVTGRTPARPAFEAHNPPYLEGRLPLNPEQPRTPEGVRQLPGTESATPIDLPLAGETVRVEPGDEGALFERTFADTETLLALHRFAWLPLMGAAADPAWVCALWRAWSERFHAPSDGWPWHPYTAAERAINILDFVARAGYPAEPAVLATNLAAHAPAIAERLEYFGESYTSNHLANNGRGLYRLGLAFGLEQARDLGADILINEAPRIFLTSGMLREGSSHYHLLLTRNYLDAWLAARADARPETAALGDIAARALAAVPTLMLSDHMPLIGDISPDCPPGFLLGLAHGHGGWVERLDDAERDAIEQLRGTVAPSDDGALAADGWLQATFGPWAGLWHCAPAGWSAMPGHGHQDCGGFEVHHADAPVFIDPGRGAYGETGDAALYRSAQVHNTLTIDDLDPYPPNRPYYDEDFRRRTCGAPPLQCRENDGVRLTHDGYSTRLPRSGPVTRDWRFTDATFRISDRVDGAGTRTVTRRLVTSLAAEVEDGAVLLRNGNTMFRVTADDGDVDLQPLTRWTAYGVGEEATAVTVSVVARLPWTSVITVEVL